MAADLSFIDVLGGADDRAAVFGQAETFKPDGSRALLDSRVILKYLVLHLTELAIVVAALIVAKRIMSIPDWTIITILLLWIVKDFAMFFKVWRSYAVHDNSPLSELLGLEATVVYDLDPVGYVRVRGELWKAETDNQECPAKRGEITRVVDTRGMTLIVEPIGSGDARCSHSAGRRGPY